MTFYSQIKWTQRKYILTCLVCIAISILLLLLRLDSNHSITSNQYPEQQDPNLLINLTAAAQHRQSLYTPSMFIPDALQHNHFRPVAAVILRTSHDQRAIYSTVDYLHKYPFVKEIYIYNLVSSHPLAIQSFERPNPWLLHKVDIHIIEKSEQEDDGMLAFFSTCSLAIYDHCYLQTDRTLNLHMDSLYTQFMRYPDLVHVNARSEEFLIHRRWQLHHQGGDVEMHAGFANLLHGAIIPQSNAQLFLNQFAAQKTSSLNQKQMADVIFSFWTNSYPYILFNPFPLAIGQDPSFQKMLDAVRQLKNALADQSPYFIKNEIDPPLDQRDVRTACDNDKCLFVTNLDPFPLTTEYNPDQNLTNSSLGSSVAWQHELDVDIPGSEFYIHRGYHAAVDGDSGTCWNTYKVPNEGDYFGLDLIGNMRVSRLVIHLRHPMEQHIHEAFKIRALNKDDGWVDCSITVDSTQSLPRRAVFHMDCRDGKPISAIRFFFTQTQSRSFDLCGLGLDNFIV
ncbi:hypothetical protein BCR42DRAFT_406851 [Absidia repens]|uniref:Uncharacterized protein n=1 Tax=Absidia repens TaxID=90262 RepID=A0A1X2IRJ3_9FUNG|nr:hypothetical protein BCR42DRAFT_406851 [Absidia repens]